MDRGTARQDSEPSGDPIERPTGWISRMDRGPNHLSRSRSRSPNRARRSFNVDDVAEDQLRDIVVRGQQEWRSRSGASGKALGVLCIFPGCTAKVMFTQSFANHFRAQHGMDRYTRGDRDQYERAIDDSELYRDSTQMTRVFQHRLQNQELGLQQVARNVSTVSGTVDDLRREVLMSARNTGSTAGLARAVDGITEEVQDIDRKLEMLFTTIMQDFDKKLQGLHKSVVEDIRKDIFKLAEGLNPRYDYIGGIVLPKLDKSVAVNRLSKRQREEETEHCQTTSKVSRSACPRPAHNDNVIMEEMEELAQPDALMGSASATSSTSTPTSMPPLTAAASSSVLHTPTPPPATTLALTPTPPPTTTLALTPTLSTSMLTPPVASVLASPLLPTPALSSTTDFALTPTPTPVSPLPTPEPASTSAPSSTPACSTPKSVPSAALVEAATTDLTAAGAVKPALTVNTTKKAKKGILSKSKAKTRFAKALEKKVKEIGVDAERYGAYVQALIQDIGAKEKEIEDIKTKLMTALDDEKKTLRASLQSMTGALESLKMSKANTKPRVCLYEVIATARDGLLRRTKLSSDIRKEEGHRRDLNHAVKDANVNVKCKQQLAFDNQDPAQQDAIANDVENAKEEVITKQLEADAQKERVSSLYLERDDFNNALSRMLDATSIVMPFVNLGEIDDDMLQVGITAQSTFMQFCEDWERR